jgi:ERCC4-related helicase
MDEAHRSVGNFAYVEVIRLLEQTGAKFRVLGLSAMPGSRVKVILKVSNALRISKIEARCDDDADVKKYTEDPDGACSVVEQIEKELNATRIEPLLRCLRDRGALRSGPPLEFLNRFCLLQAQHEYERQFKAANTRPDGILKASVAQPGVLVQFAVTCVTTALEWSGINSETENGTPKASMKSLGNCGIWFINAPIPPTQPTVLS